MNACTANACGSGKRPCPCPEACQIPELPPVKQFDKVDDAVLLLALTVLVGLLVALVVFIAHHPYLFANLFF